MKISAIDKTCKNCVKKLREKIALTCCDIFCYNDFGVVPKW